MSEAGSKRRPKAVLAAVLLLVVAVLAGVFSAGCSSATSSADEGSAAVTPHPGPPDPRDIVVMDDEDRTVTINLVMVGDILLHDQLVNAGAQGDGSYDYSFLFAHTRDVIEAADVAILNQETIMGGAERGSGLHVYQVETGTTTDEEGNEVATTMNIPVFNSPTAVADAEVAAGFDVVLKAHNHVFDQGYSGLAHELAYWSSTYPQIPVLGVSDPSGQSSATDYVQNVYIYEKDGFRIAILNYATGTNASGGGNDYAVLSYLSEDKIRSDCEKARAAGADMIVACPHWGTEYVTSATDAQRYWAQVLAENGVDIIFGTHPHVIEPIEVFQASDGHTCVCYYSNGSFVSSDFPDANCYIAGIDRVTVQQEEDGTCHVVYADFLPTVVNLKAGDMGARLVSDYTDEVAAGHSRPELTPQHVRDYCSQVLGEGFDPNTGVYTVDLPEN